MDIIYFDNSATTRVSEAALDAAERALRCDWGNPSSVHGKGIEAERLVSAARAEIVKALGVKNPRSGRLIFTGSGTEADNLAISGSIYGKKYRFRPRIVTTDSEHPAVANTLNFAEAHGFEVIRLSTKGGIIDDEELYSALTPETVLVSVMRVNNETGAVYDVGKIFSLAKQRCPEAVTHCDAVQGFLKLNCAPSKLNADLVTVSGHKIGAPKGIGALWCSEELIFHKRLKPVIFGGGQEERTPLRHRKRLRNRRNGSGGRRTCAEYVAPTVRPSQPSAKGSSPPSPTVFRSISLSESICRTSSASMSPA